VHSEAELALFFPTIPVDSASLGSFFNFSNNLLYFKFLPQTRGIYLRLESF
jgi:hypothetical protein